MTPLLEATRLEKAFGATPALDAFDLRVAAGEVAGLVGHNGAGKTTFARATAGLVALDAVDLEIAKGEIFALLGPNGAGKTTLIGVVCGTVSMTSGRVLIAGHDVVRDYRAARALVAKTLVPSTT